MGFNSVLKSKNLYLLYLLPFILVAIAFLRFTLDGDGGIICRENGLISFPFLNENQHLLWLKAAGMFVLLCLSFLIFFIADRYKFLSRITVLPALLYALMSAGIICHYGVNNYLLAAFCMIVAISRLQSAIVHSNSNAPVFGFGLFTCLAVLLCPKLVSLLLWAIVVLPFSGRANVKDLVALFIGFFTTLFFTAAYYFWTDQLFELPAVFSETLLAGEGFWRLMPEKLAAYIVFGVLIIVSLYNVIVNSATAIVAQRRGIFSMLSMLLFAGSSLFFIPFNCHGIMLILAIPLSYLFSQYFISHRTRWLGNVLFLLLLAACVWIIW